MKETSVSVIMSVYNEDNYILVEAIDSILNQTYRNFEFIIIGDNPDNERVINLIMDYQSKDSRVKFFQNKQNVGLTRSLNIGLSLCNGRYIARMDADDISMPDRLEKEISFLDEHPDVSIVHSYISLFGADNKEETIRICPSSNQSIIEVLMHSNCINHPAVMFRKDAFDKLDIKYNEEYRRSQDYELWLHAAMMGCEFATIPEPLLRYRISDNQITTSHRVEQLTDENNIKRTFFKRLCETYSLKYPKQITRNYIENFIVTDKKNNNIEFMQNALRFQLYYTLPRSFKKLIQIIPDSYKMGFSFKQILILLLSFFIKKRWSGLEMNYLVIK